jgi:uncharacterized protein DUF6600/FecR-like protein
MRFLRTTLTLAAVSLSAPMPFARAQDSYDAPPPHLSVVEGTVTLDREDASDPATSGVPMVPGDRLRTERGRAELLFPDGSALDLDEYSTIVLEGPTLLRMTSGRVLLFAAGANNPASVVQFQIDTPVASAQTDGPGEYRISLLGGPSAMQTEMAVVRGGGALVTEVGSVALRGGERSTAWDNAAPSRPQYFNSARYDALDQWATSLRDERLGSRSQSAQYLPADLRVYGGELDRYGSWNYEEPYGYVWYPTVAPEWRPYYDGYWSPVPIYGWTWIGADVWSWPTHHYGRWGYARSRWFWIPERRWSPAWVSWGGAPGYVSWCPLGFDNRPVFALSVSVGSGYRGWNGWTVVSRDHFGGHRSAREFAVAPRSLPANVGFVAQASAPVAPPRAVPRQRAGNSGQFAGDQPQFPNVVGRSSDGQRQRAVPRGGANADRPGEGQATQSGRPTSITRSPQGVSRQPQTAQTNPQPPQGGRQQPPEQGGQRQRSEQGGQQPRTEQGGSGDRPRAVSRQPHSPAGQTQAPQTPSAQTPQNGDPQPNDGHRRGTARTRQSDGGNKNPQEQRESLTYSARPRYDRPSVPQAPPQPSAPPAPQMYDRSQGRRAIQRAEPIRPAQPPQPDSPQPGFSRRSGGSIYTERPAAPPPIAAAQAAPQRQERQQAPRSQEQRASQPREKRPPSDEARSRGHERQQQSSSDAQEKGGGNGNGHHRR